MSRLMNTLHQYKPHRLKKANKREKKIQNQQLLGLLYFFKEKTIIVIT